MTKKINAEIVVMTIVALIGIGGIIWLFTPSNNSHDESKMYRHCYIYSQTLVKEQLKSPDSAKFPAYSDSFAKYDEKTNTVTIKAYVNAQNSLGATVKTNYTAIITVDSGHAKSGFVTIG